MFRRQVDISAVSPFLPLPCHLHYVASKLHLLCFWLRSIMRILRLMAIEFAAAANCIPFKKYGRGRRSSFVLWHDNPIWIHADVSSYYVLYYEFLSYKAMANPQPQSLHRWQWHDLKNKYMLSISPSNLTYHCNERTNKSIASYEDEGKMMRIIEQ